MLLNQHRISYKSVQVMAIIKCVLLSVFCWLRGLPFERLIGSDGTSVLRRTDDYGAGGYLLRSVFRTDTSHPLKGESGSGIVDSSHMVFNSLCEGLADAFNASVRVMCQVIPFVWVFPEIVKFGSS